MCRCVVGAHDWSAGGWLRWLIHSVRRGKRWRWGLIIAVVGLNRRRRRCWRRHWNAGLRLRLRVGRVARWHCHIRQRTPAWILLTIITAVVPFRVIATSAFIGTMTMGSASLAESLGARVDSALHDCIIVVPKWTSVIQSGVNRHDGELLGKGWWLKRCRRHTCHVR